MVLMAFGFALGYQLFWTQHEDEMYLFYDAPKDLVWKSLASYYLLYQLLVPFTMLICMEMAKLFYAYWMIYDVSLMSEETGQGALVQGINVLEDLGEIKYLFCDKTGTLT